MQLRPIPLDQGPKTKQVAVEPCIVIVIFKGSDLMTINADSTKAKARTNVVEGGSISKTNAFVETSGVVGGCSGRVKAFS